MLKLQAVIFRPLLKFMELEAASSILLLTATILALIWANSPWYETYHTFWHTPVTLGLGPLVFREDVHFWINDALMAIFFLVVGLEIKRELIVGELSSPRQAALPLAAAVGGILVPAALYMILNPPGTEFFRGWGVPVVTDIAFAIGVLTVLGSRVPLGLKVFLTALAIVDDLGAILLIALFYSGGLQTDALLFGLGLLVILFAMNRSGIKHPLPYLLTGILLWVAVLQSGLHATIAGVLLALMIPAKGTIVPADFYRHSQEALGRFQRAGIPQNSLILTNYEHQASVQQLETLCEGVQAPLQRLEHILHPWSSFVILPIFALANAGVHLEPSHVAMAFTHPITISVILGLVVGKQIGITLFAWLAVRSGLASLPLGVRWSGIYGTSILGGIGFTMSLFVSVLAFTDASHIDNAKIGILMASLVSGVTGALVLRSVLKKGKGEGHAKNPLSH